MNVCYQVASSSLLASSTCINLCLTLLDICKRATSCWNNLHKVDKKSRQSTCIKPAVMIKSDQAPRSHPDTGLMTERQLTCSRIDATCAFLTVRNLKVCAWSALRLAVSASLRPTYTDATKQLTKYSKTVGTVVICCFSIFVNPTLNLAIVNYCNTLAPRRSVYISST